MKSIKIVTCFVHSDHIFIFFLETLFRCSGGNIYKLMTQRYVRVFFCKGCTKFIYTVVSKKVSLLASLKIHNPVQHSGLNIQKVKQIVS